MLANDVTSITCVPVLPNPGYSKTNMVCMRTAGRSFVQGGSLFDIAYTVDLICGYAGGPELYSQTLFHTVSVFQHL